MLNRTTLLFDLDGTLTDSCPGILNSLTYALRQMGVPVPPRETLLHFIGPPLLDSFQRWCSLSPETAREGVRKYREYFEKSGMFENSVYPGIPELLRRLKSGGRRLVIATGKPEPYARQIAEHFGIADMFEHICGATMDQARTGKADVIRYALDRCGGVHPAAALMIGDRENDVAGARHCGLDCVGVLYGYGSRTELEEAGAAYIARDVAELGQLLGA